MHRHFYRPDAVPPTRPSVGTGKRILWILLVSCLAAGIISLFQQRKDRVYAPPRPEPMVRMSPERLQEYVSANVVVAAAAGGLQDLRQRTDSSEFAISGLDEITQPRGGIRLSRIRSERSHTSKDRALTDALLVAQQKLTEKLQALHSPLLNPPPLSKIREDYLIPDSVRVIEPPPEIKAEWEAANLEPNRIWVEVDVEIRPEQLRLLIANHRRMQAGLWFTLAFVSVVAGYGFLRLDALTKGYLTTMLGVAAVLLVIAAAAVLAMLR
jgi:hypothetical protein